MELVPLLLGWEVVPRCLALEGAGDEPVRQPVTAALVRRPAGGHVLLDAGLTPDRPAGLDDLYPHALPERVPLQAALARAGVRAQDVAVVAVSHLHLDHTGGLRELGHARVVVQRRELEHGQRARLDEGYWAADWEGVAFEAADGDGELVPGVGLLSTPGHTPGHMSFVVDLPLSGRWILAADAVQVAAGAEHDRVIGPASDADDPAARRASHDRLLALARAEDARLVPGHCPRTWPDLAFRTLL